MLFTAITAADRLPPLLRTFLSSPRLSFGCVLLFCSLLDLVIIFPGYVVSLLLTEVGLYLSIITAAWCLGRWIIRIITFPGSTYRLYNDIEVEFAKYSIRILDHCLDTTLDLTHTLFQLKGKDVITKSDLHGASMLIRKTFIYRNCVFAVFASVLNNVYNYEAESSTIDSQDCNHAFTDAPFVNVSARAIAHGKQFLFLLKGLLSHLHELEQLIGKEHGSHVLSDHAQNLARLVHVMAMDIKQHLPLLKPDSVIIHSITPNKADNNSTKEVSTHSDDHEETQREVNFSFKDRLTILSKVIMHHIDPPLHSSIFNLDVQRGCFLARYKGSKQLWIPSHDGQGMIDAIHVPSISNDDTYSITSINRRAVVYCNPNAGLMELTTGMSFFGGNMTRGEANREVNNWVDFYLAKGFDIYLFNYRGYGRSYIEQRQRHKRRAKISHLLYVLYKSLFAFRPSPQSLKDDALTVCKHVIRICEMRKNISNNNIEAETVRVRSMEEGSLQLSYPAQLIIHGESIGGMASAYSARMLCSETTGDTPPFEVLLICDRTFSNLIAVARRMVGDWTKIIIPYLVPDWCTDVAADYMSAACKKVVAQDTRNDTIIHDMASLKSGIAMACELYRGVSNSVDLNQHSHRYRIQEFEHRGLAYLAPKPPMWSIDESFTLQQALHFAACILRMHKLASSSLSKNTCSTHDIEENGVEIRLIHSPNKELRPVNGGNEIPTIEKIWGKLSSCDGIAGPILGIVADQGLEYTIFWICSLIVFGAQLVKGEGTPYTPEDVVRITNLRISMENDIKKILEPITKVLDDLKSIQGHCSFKEFQHELEYCISSLEYIVQRILNRCQGNFMQSYDGIYRFTGHYVDLSCGHNNFYSVAEQDILSGLIKITFSTAA